MQAAALRDVEQSAKDVADARDEFRNALVARALIEHGGVLTMLGRTVENPSVIGRTNYTVHLEETAANVAQVVFSDHERPYEVKFHLTVDVIIDGDLVPLRRAWLHALVVEDEARKRDTRMGQMTADARTKLIKDALEASEEGQAAIAAFQEFAKKQVRT